jgi:outer membrane murein-binding lipoprotein Lpp/predicted Fe-S protein YdhL (DUF1289 family)
MIDPVKHHGRELARCTCDECQAVLEFPAMHGTMGGTRKVEPVLQNKGSVTKAYQAKGWAMIGRKLVCAECQEKRRETSRWLLTASKEKPAMTNVESIRQPTREQKRQITEMLTDCYDTKAGRYTGTETDKTIAEAIGGGCMFGWVDAIREDMFGPDGGNEEHTAIATALLELSAKADTLETVVQAVMRDLKAVRTDVRAMQERLASVVKAVGPKAVRA